MGKAKKGTVPGSPGGPLPCQLTEICVYDSADVLDQAISEWGRGWETRYRRVKTIRLFDVSEFNASVTSITSKSFFCEPYKKFSLLLDLAITGTPTDILIEVKFSDDNAKFYKLMNGPFGDLRYEDSAGNLLEEIQGECRASYGHVKATATGTSGANKFTLNAKMVFNS